MPQISSTAKRKLDDLEQPSTLRRLMEEFYKATYNDPGFSPMPMAVGISSIASQIPSRLFHVSGKIPEIIRSGVLKAGGGMKGGGLGQLFDEPIISLTTDLPTAQLIKQDLSRAIALRSGERGQGALIKIAMEDAPLGKEKILREQAKKAERFVETTYRNRLQSLEDLLSDTSSVEDYFKYNPKGRPSGVSTLDDLKNFLVDQFRSFQQAERLDAFKQLQMKRQHIGGSIDPVILGGEKFAGMSSKDVGILSIPKENIPEGAIADLFNSLKELRLYKTPQVPISGYELIR